MSVAAASAGLAVARRRYRRRRVLIEAGSVVLAVMLLIWSLLPVYNMFLIALDPEEGEIEFTGNIWPPEPSLDAFGVVLTQADRYLEEFLAAVRQQPLYRPDDDGADRADRVAGELRGRAGCGCGKGSLLTNAALSPT